MRTAHTEALVQLQAFEDAFGRLKDGNITASALNDQTRGFQALQQSLPERYMPVLLQLLDRLESSAAFTEESCSFSQADLHTHIEQWIAKARGQLA